MAQILPFGECETKESMPGEALTCRKFTRPFGAEFRSVYFNGTRKELKQGGRFRNGVASSGKAPKWVQLLVLHKQIFI